MYGQLLQVKVPKKDLDLRLSLASQLHKLSLFHNKPLSWWQFSADELCLGDKEEFKWQILCAVVEKTSRQHPHTSSDTIIETLSHLINTTVETEISLCLNNPGVKEHPVCRYWSRKLIAELAHQKQFILRYPWYIPIDITKDLEWESLDIVTGHTVRLKLRQESNFVFYEFIRPHH